MSKPITTSKAALFAGALALLAGVPVRRSVLNMLSPEDLTKLREIERQQRPARLDKMLAKVRGESSDRSTPKRQRRDAQLDELLQKVRR